MWKKIRIQISRHNFHNPTLEWTPNPTLQITTNPTLEWTLKPYAWQNPPTIRLTEPTNLTLDKMWTSSIAVYLDEDKTADSSNISRKITFSNVLKKCPRVVAWIHGLRDIVCSNQHIKMELNTSNITRSLLYEHSLPLSQLSHIHASAV